MNTYTVQTLTNSHREPKWILKSESTMTAEYPEDILDKYEYPGTFRRNGYSDGIVEGIWELFDEDAYDTIRTAMIVSPVVN